MSVSNQIPAVETSASGVIGRIHSVETCGTVDGPGIRFIVFMQGCLMRCKYCHNRDTWDTQGGREVTVPELMSDITSYRHFMNASGGGVTAPAKPCCQQNFIAELFAACRRMVSHLSRYQRLCDSLRQTARQGARQHDLVLPTSNRSRTRSNIPLTPRQQQVHLEFARYLAAKAYMWIRYVVVPTWSDVTRAPRDWASHRRNWGIVSRRWNAALSRAGKPSGTCG